MSDPTIPLPPIRRTIPRRKPLPTSATSLAAAPAALQLVPTAEEATPNRKFVKGAPPIRNLLAFQLNDHGNAQRVIALHGADLYYCHPFKKWMVWDGTRWSIDDTGQARRLATLTMVEFLRQTLHCGSDEKKDFASSSLNSGAIGAMLKMAEPEHFIRPADLDTDPNLLNFLNGTLDLKTGVLRPHRREDFITKLIHHNYNPGAKCPLWLAFLNTIMKGNRQMVAYLWKALGYSLTGSTREKAVFVPVGDTDTGKTTFLSTFRKLIAEYSTLIQVQTLMVMREENNTAQADLADLFGVRFAMTSEADKGQRLSQGKLKRITQGQGDIRACRKYENPFSFRETHKLWLDTNVKPEVSDDDGNATFNRLHAIPFVVKIPSAEMDRDLPAKLLAEAEGILAWAVAGAKLWHKHGLGKPPAVAAAVEEWRAESDTVERFVAARCKNGGRATGDELYQAYEQWAKTGGLKREQVLNQNEFGTKMGQRPGIKKKHTNKANFYEGIQLKQLKQSKFNCVAKLDRSPKVKGEGR